METKLVRFLISTAILFINALQVSGQGFSVDNLQLINGYKRTIEGEVLPYFSLYRKYAKQALLTRCTDGKKAIEWETDIIPADIKGEYAYFTWIAAHSSGTSSGVRNFDLHINDEYALTFTTYPQQYPPYWAFTAKDSTSLLFEFKTKDGAADSHGMAYLRVPLSKYKQGSSLRLKVVGQNQNSNDWYMTFCYSFKEKIEIAALPFLLKDGKKQLLQVTVLHFGQPENLNIKINKEQYARYTVKNGFNSFDVEIPAVQKKQILAVNAVIGKVLSVIENVAIHPVIFREINLVHHSHTDIGYSHIQEEVIKIHNNNIRRTLALIEKTKNYPAGSRFIWHIESSWAVENFLQEASPKEKEQFIKAVRNGQIVISALYANILTGLCMPEEIDWITDYSIMLRDRYQLPVKTALMTDIPGMSWSVVASLAKRGIRYFSNGINYIEGMPGNGDRIGFSLVKLGDKPFWWKSPLGKDSILMWCGGKGYSSWHGFGQGAVFERGAEKIAEYLSQLNANNYPYSMVQWRYNVVADNGPTDSTIADFIVQWNKKYASPRLVLANVGEMFQKFEQLYGKRIPSLTGDFTPYWEDGAYSTAKEEAANRMAAQKIIGLEKFAAQKKMAIDKELLYQAKRNVLLFHEHTWGAHNSISDPDNPFVIHQWNYKKRFVDSAVYYAEKIERDLINSNKQHNVITVVNTLPYIRSTYVEVSNPPAFTGNILKDEKGKEVIVQRLQNGNIGFVAMNLPPNGEKKYRLINERKESKAAGDYPVTLSMDHNTGAINSVKTKGKEWVDTSVFKGLMQSLYVNGLDPEKYQEANIINVAELENGPVVKEVLAKYSMPGTNGLEYKIRQYNGLDQLKISVTIDKKLVRDKESIHIALPFNIADAVVRMGVEDGVIGPELSQLPGANRDYFSVQQWLNVSGKNNSVTISCPQGALFEVGEMVNEEKVINGYKKWKEKAASSPTVFLYAMNNYWHTNFKIDQDGRVTFDVYLKFHSGSFNVEKAVQFGYECSQPVIGIPAK